MIFNDHSKLEGQHAILGASRWNWINYDIPRLTEYVNGLLAIKRGTELHAFAAQAISLGEKLRRCKNTLNMYVNDAIDYHMSPEKVLQYTNNCFGTTDAIRFDDSGFLRIHDLKTGVTPTHMEQLEIYAALFCLEYGIEPSDIGMELRIYQNCDINILDPNRNDIKNIMEKMILFDPIIQELKG